MKVSELYRKLLRVHVDGPDDEIGGGTVQTVEAGSNITVDNTDPAHPVVAGTGGGGGGIEPGEPLTQYTGEDGGIGYEGPDNVPVFVFKTDGDTHDRIAIWADGSVNFGDGTTFPDSYIKATSEGVAVSARNTGQKTLRLSGAGAGGGGELVISDHSQFTGPVVASEFDGTLSGGVLTTYFLMSGGGNQPTAIADATDPASTQARLNDLLAAMRVLGLIAT